MNLGNPRDELRSLIDEMLRDPHSSKNVLDRLQDFSNRVCPKRLYRYRRISEHTLADLQNETATLSLAKNFDVDPDDCLLHDLGGLENAVNIIASSNPNDLSLKTQIANIGQQIKTILICRFCKRTKSFSV